MKIPRDAARPKLEDLLDWQAEIPDLPFQPEEEQILESIIDQASTFREFMRSFTNPACMTAEEVPTQVFYLRKIEGAEVLLAYETNYFRQEIHKWAPVAPEPPPILEQSLSTRKPRPTKQQKMMAQLGVEKPEDLPLHLRTKQHTFTNKRKSTDSHGGRPPPLQPAPLNPSETPLGDPRSASTGNAPSPNSLGPISGSQHPASFAFSHPFPLSSNDGSPAYGPGSSSFLPQVNTVNSPSFSPTSPTSHHPGLDPSLFSPPGFGRAHQLPHGPQDVISKDDVGVDVDVDGHNPFSSSPRANMDDLFADLTNQDAEPLEALETSHANEALEALRDASNSGSREGSASGTADMLDGASRESGHMDAGRIRDGEDATNALADDFLD